MSSKVLQPLFTHEFEAPIGTVLLSFNSLGLIKISYKDHSLPANQPNSTSPYLKSTKIALKNFFKAKPYHLDFLDWSICTTFQTKVLKSLSLLHAGETLSYKDLATQVGHPKSARAVGTCMRLNPWPLLVPCHRIIPSSGGLGNYSLGGPAIKASLLQMEEKARLKLGQK